jgi:DNA-binding protein H-NS
MLPRNVDRVGWGKTRPSGWRQYTLANFVKNSKVWVFTNSVEISDCALQQSRGASYHRKIGQEITMPKVSLSGMTVEALMDLRRRVDEMLHQHRAKLEKQLESIALVGGARVVRGGGSALKGRKVPPKYRSRSGETWAGRGAKPKWLVDAIKGGKKLEEFLIDKGRRKRRSKR